VAVVLTALYSDSKHMRFSRLLFQLAAFTVTALLPQTAMTQGFDQLRRGVVRVGVGDPGTERSAGTGFIVDERCTFLTARHVIERAPQDKIVISFQNPAAPSQTLKFRARLLFASPDQDLAFLRVDAIDGKPCTSTAPMHTFRIRKEALDSTFVGAPISIVGHPVLALGGGSVDIPVLRRGHLASVEITVTAGVPSLLLDLMGVPGFSGSPVILDATGEVIGVVYGPGQADRQWGFEWATPVVLDDYRIATTQRPVP
jgi:S1-C subfamily serine protease